MTVEQIRAIVVKHFPTIMGGSTIDAVNLRLHEQNQAFKIINEVLKTMRKELTNGR